MPRLPELDVDPAVQAVLLAPPVPNTGNVRSPLREISPPPSPTLVGSAHPHSDDEDQPRRRRIPNASASTANRGNTLPHNDVISSALFKETVPNRASSSINAVRQALPLSPAVRGPIVIDSDDEDENTTWESRNRPMRPIPARARSSTSSAKPPSPSAGKGKEKATESDYDDDMFEELPSSFYDEIDKVELAVGMKSLSTASVVSTSTGRGSTTDHSASFSVVHSEVITVEDDDEDDKENVPAPTRHVRQRRGVPPIMVATDDILELSDSD
ncbi:uncharacterized protein C8R40DRAFT_62115 [Lentinula edodes]|uniref:uncharacterized protein n=1 Tax=Lentinula edodes TaxID=5353 RepID=UPI001E8EF07E|nr:uncharacterized protein C8R40DRAFT_62115 [Lentinula edodes]KAH7877187.1 hypothetical protein C8R40DRAFT_62115 [Lentinula edodes]